MLTVFMGTPLLLALRKSYGPLAFWSAGIILTALVFPVWFIIGTVWILVGAYYEIERKAKNWWISGFVSLILSSIFGLLSSYQSLRASGIETREQFEQLVGEVIGKIQTMSPALNIETKDILFQIPSLMLATLLIGLFTAIIFERRVLDWFSLPRKNDQSRRLIEFKVPDFFIWITLAALLCVAYDFGQKALGVLGLNIVNVLAILYFFQGIAVIESYLRFVKAGPIMRFLTYFILVGQLFLLVSILGLADFWMDFRKRMQNLTSRPGNQ